MNRLLLFLLVVLTQCGWAYPNGWDGGVIKPTGIYYPVSSNTTNQTMTAYQSGSTLIFTGSNANTQFTLPLCNNTLGIDYTFIDDTTNFIAIIPQSTDIIEVPSTIRGQGVENATSTAIGNNITLICRSKNIWSVEGASGTWATGN